MPQSRGSVQGLLRTVKYMKTLHNVLEVQLLLQVNWMEFPWLQEHRLEIPEQASIWHWV
ncbi:MAG: hypothetical protein CM1200mP30_26160 [Pseudomonadota bacterium]|nr:MAG: hypothetical protein CM1200mP30_26160 [Pseudomonadota bacterium]